MLQKPGLEGFRDSLSGRPAAEVVSEIAGSIQRGQSFLVTSHVSPDGDAVGSEAALGLALRFLEKRVAVVNSQPLPERFEAFVPDGLMTAADARWLASPGTYDWCIVLDASEPERTGVLKAKVFAEGQRRLCIDHHLHEAGGLYDHHLVVPEAPATGSLVLALIDALGVPLDREMARLLWLAVASDTGWFRFANTTPVALRDAQRLLAEGLDPETLYEEIYGSHSLGRMRLLGEVLGSLKSAYGGRLAWGYVSRKAIDAKGVTLPELEGVIDHFKSLKGALVVALITEIGDSSYKVSLRSMGKVRVEGIARRFAGGGHAKAAGFRYQGRLEELEVELCRAVAAEPGVIDGSAGPEAG